MDPLYQFYRGPVAQNVTIRAWGVDAHGVRRVVYFEPGERSGYHEAKAQIFEIHKRDVVPGTERAA